MVNGVTGFGGAGGIDPAMMREMRAARFKEIDADSSGGLDETEFATLIDGMPEDGKGPQISTDDYATIDADQDGSMTQDELDAYMESQIQSTMEMQFNVDPAQMRQDIFSKLDANGDGGLTEDEFESMKQDINDTAKANEGASFFSEMDADEDGVVTIDEMRAFDETHMPPPPPEGGFGGEDMMSTASSTSSSISYEPVNVMA